MTAPCFIHVFGAHDNAFVRLRGALCAVGRIPANDTDCKGLRDVLGDCEKLRHRLERLAPIVLVESGNDHAFSSVCKLLADVHNVWSKELSFIDTDNLCVR